MVETYEVQVWFNVHIPARIDPAKPWTHGNRYADFQLFESVDPWRPQTREDEKIKRQAFYELKPWTREEADEVFHSILNAWETAFLQTDIQVQQSGSVIAGVYAHVNIICTSIVSAMSAPQAIESAESSIDDILSKNSLDTQYKVIKSNVTCERADGECSPYKHALSGDYYLLWETLDDLEDSDVSKFTGCYGPLTEDEWQQITQNGPFFLHSGRFEPGSQLVEWIQQQDWIPVDFSTDPGPEQ